MRSLARQTTATLLVLVLAATAGDAAAQAPTQSSWSGAPSPAATSPESIIVTLATAQAPWRSVSSVVAKESSDLARRSGTITTRAGARSWGVSAHFSMTVRPGTSQRCCN